MMILFTISDAVRLLKPWLSPANAAAVEVLIEARTLKVSAYSSRGQALFDAKAIIEAAETAQRSLLEREAEGAPPAP